MIPVYRLAKEKQLKLSLWHLASHYVCSTQHEWHLKRDQKGLPTWILPIKGLQLQKARHILETYCIKYALSHIFINYSSYSTDSLSFLLCISDKFTAAVSWSSMALKPPGIETKPRNVFPANRWPKMMSRKISAVVPGVDLTKKAENHNCHCHKVYTNLCQSSHSTASNYQFFIDP